MGNTNTTQSQETSLLSINFFQAFKCSKKTRTGPFTRWSMREGSSSVTTGLLLLDLRTKMIFQALGIHRNDFFQPRRENLFWKVLPGSAPEMPVTTGSSGRVPTHPPCPCPGPLLAGKKGCAQPVQDNLRAPLVPCRRTPHDALAYSHGGRLGCPLRRCSPA